MLGKSSFANKGNVLLMTSEESFWYLEWESTQTEFQQFPNKNLYRRGVEKNQRVLA